MELSELRKEIDETDDMLLSAFIKRMHLSEKIAEYKKEHELKVFSPEREEALLMRIEEKSGDMAHYTRALYHSILFLSKRRQEEIIDKE